VAGLERALPASWYLGCRAVPAGAGTAAVPGVVLRRAGRPVERPGSLVVLCRVVDIAPFVPDRPALTTAQPQPTYLV
jgi:hypothetical protein